MHTDEIQNMVPNCGELGVLGKGGHFLWIFFLSGCARASVAGITTYGRTRRGHRWPLPLVNPDTLSRRAVNSLLCLRRCSTLLELRLRDIPSAARYTVLPHRSPSRRVSGARIYPARHGAQTA